MDTTNARISFSTSSEKTWEDVNPKLMEGEPVFAKTGDGKYKLVVGNIGGSNYKESVLVWDQKNAEKMLRDSETAVKNAQSSAGSAKSSAESATNSATAAKSSEQIVSGYVTEAENAKTKSEEILKSVQQSEGNAKTSEKNAKASEEKSVTVSAEAVQAATNAKQSESNALSSASNAKDSEANAKTHEDTTAGYANAASESLGQVNQAKKDAETAAASALSSKNAAEQSASSASTSESKVKASELAASGFSESAQASAGSAKEYYEKAEASAAAAASSELSAKNQAQSAAQSSTSADTSASAAAGSASAALQSQNAAKTSADESLKTETSCKSIYEQIKNAPEILNAERYYQKEESDARYQVKGNYIEKSTWDDTFVRFIYPGNHQPYININFKDVTFIKFNRPLFDYYDKQETDTRYQKKGDSYTKVESDSKYQAKGDYVTTGVANETYLGKNALEEIKNRLDTIENIARTPTGSLVTYDLQEGLLGTIPERIQVIKVSCIESPKDFVFCGMRTGDRELSFHLDQTGSGVCLKLSNKNTQIETVTVAINIMPHFKIEWSYEINKQTPDKFFN